MHFYSTPAFLAALQAAYPSIAGARPADVHVGDQGRFRVLVGNRNRPLPTLPFVDYLVPLTGEEEPAAQRVDVGHLDNVSIECIPVAAFIERQTAAGLDVTDAVVADSDGGRRTLAPYIDWSEFSTIEEYSATIRRQNSKRAFRQSRKQMSPVEREFGSPHTINLVDDDPAHFEQCLAWKGEQFLSTGGRDLIAEGAGDLIRHLRDDGKLICSTLSVDDRLLAAHIGFLHDRVFHYWIPSYDPAASKAAPGLLLMDRLLAESLERGDSAFDFLEGQEPYKFNYATHVRVIGTIGAPSPMRRAARRARRRLGHEIRERPRVANALQSVRSIRHRFTASN